MHLSWAIVRSSLTRTKGRLALIAASVALGVFLLLTVAAFWNATSVTSHANWREAAYEASSAYDRATYAEDHALLRSLEEGNMRVLHMPRASVMVAGEKQVNVFYVDITGVSEPPDLAGITWPGEGQYLVSQALHDYIKANPAVALDKRLGRESIGILPNELVFGPDEMLAIVGQDLSERGYPVADFIPEGAPGILSYKPVLIIGLVVLLVPILLLLAVSAALGSVQREQRYAALRLVGATTKQIAQIVILEALVGAIPGYLLGAALFVILQPALSQIPLTGQRYWPADVSVGPLGYGLIALATLGLVVVANLWGLRSVRTSPLGVVRRQRSAGAGRPSAWRLAGIGIALAIFVYLAMTVHENLALRQEIFLLLAGVVILMVGLLVASPWLVVKTGDIVRRCARSGPAIIGSTYVGAHSRRIARSVSGVVLALFAGAFFLTTVSEAISFEDERWLKEQLPETSVALINLWPGQAEELAENLAGKPYVDEVVVAHYEAGSWLVLPCDFASDFAAVSCADESVVAIDFWLPTSTGGAVLEAPSHEELREQMSLDFNAYLDEPEQGLALRLHSASDIELLRNEISALEFDDWVNIHMFSNLKSEPIDQSGVWVMTQLVYAGIALTLAIAIASMLVSSYASILERRRSLLTLRLSGMRVREIMKMMLVESALPLAVISILATAAGFGAGWLLMHMVSKSLDAVFTPLLFAVVGSALGLAVLAIISLGPTLRRVTAPSNNVRE